MLHNNHIWSDENPHAIIIGVFTDFKMIQSFFKDWPVDCVQRCRPMTHIGYDVTDGYINLRYWHWLYPMVDVIREKVNAERLTVGQITD